MSGLYIHMPWCVRKCPYCDFNSYELTQPINEQAYVNRLLQEIEQKLETWPLPIETIYFGGGTPSLFQPDSFRRVINHLDLPLVTEMTMEINPGITEHTDFVKYREAGINRVSLGVQSFNSKHLQRLGRIHNADEAKQALTNALAADFDVVNVDLMYGLPHQTLNEVLEDLQELDKFQPTHISWYELTIEPNTHFAKFRPAGLPHHDQKAQLSEAGWSYLAELGYERYEVSAFSKDGKMCEHNKNYWMFGDFLGIGAGAHGKLTTESGVMRTANVRTPKSYLAGASGSETAISTEDLPVEFMMNVLRLTKGVPEALFTERTGLPLETIQPVLNKLRSWAMMDGDNLRLTDNGFIQLNSVVEQFLPVPYSPKRETSLEVVDC